MAFDSSGDSSAMFGSKMESPPEEEDLEDGEIASDEEGAIADSGPKTQGKPVEKPTPKHEPTAAVTTSPSTPKAGKTAQQQSEDDFAKDLQKLKEEVERKKDGRREPKKKREMEERDKRRKRRPSDDSKPRKEKRRKIDGNKTEEKNEEEDIDEDEMLGLCIRGASPTLNLDKTEVWSGKQPILDPNWQLYDDNSENESDFDERDDRKRRRRDNKDRRGFKANLREDRDIKKRLQMKRKGKNRKDMDNQDMICINFMKGNCNKGNDCFYSHAICPPKKMELCKFYLMDCCAKRDKCLYLHDEFPCKFFHTGLKCYSGKKCKFSHDPLNSLSKDILLKHLETAPKEILGDFPRLSRDCAETMVNNKTTGKPVDTSKIPSLFDIQVSIPAEFQSSGDKPEERTTPPCSPPPNVKTSPKTKPKDQATKFYEDVDPDDIEGIGHTEGTIDFAKELEAYKSKQQQNKSSDNQGAESSEKPPGFDAMTYFSNSLSSNQQSQESVKVEQEEKPHRKHRKQKDDGTETESDKEGRRKRKHEERHKKKSRRKEGEDGKPEEHKKSRGRKPSKKDLERSDKADFSPVQLTEDGNFGGIKFKIINRKEIRKSSDSDREVLLPMKIEKPNEFLSSDDEKPLNYFVKKEKKNDSLNKSSEDVDRLGMDLKTEPGDETDENEPDNKLVIETNDDQELDEDEKQEEPVVPKHLPKKQQELFLRIQAQQNQKVKEEQERKRREQESERERKTSVGSGSDAEVGRTPSPEPADENWYSSDDEEVAKKDNPLKMVLQSLSSDKKSSLSQNPPESSRSLTPPPPKPKIEFTALNNDLSKINITELLSSIRQVTSKSTSNASELKPAIVPPAASYEPPKVENPVKMNFFNSEPEKKEIKDPRLRDPRTASEPKTAITRRTSADDKTPYGKSIYDSANFKIETQDSDLRFQSKFDADERVKNLDSIVPFGDVDLRTLGGQPEPPEGDFDLRKFGLPFKPVPVHSAATEIDAGLNSHPPINYKVEAILIPRPDFSSIKISPNDPQVKKDPRLRRLFRINSSDGDPKEETKKSGLPSDPRQRKHAIADTPKSPTESPFSPKQSETGMSNNPNFLNANLLLLAQLGLSAAAGSTVFDPRLQQLLNKNPQELEMLRNQLSNVKSQSDFDLFRNQLMNNENSEMIRPPNQGLLPTPIPGPGMGLLGPAPPFMMPGMGMPDPSVMMGPMGPMGQNPMGQNPMGQNPMGFDHRYGGNQNDDDMNEPDIRHFNNRGFRGDRRGRGSWRGNRDRNWDRDGRRHKRDDRDRGRHNRDRDDRRERKRSSTPD